MLKKNQKNIEKRRDWLLEPIKRKERVK